MRIRILTFLSILTLCSLPFLANAATYNWYFSNNANGNAVGNDTTGDGSIGNPWKSLSKAETMANSYGPSDIVNLYFDGGDIWSEDTEDPGRDLNNFRVRSGEARVNILSYGTGRAIFDGGMAADFAGAATDGVGNAHRYNRYFQFEVDYCSITNVTIRNTYGNAVFLKDADNFTLASNTIYNNGYSAIAAADSTGGEDNIVEYNTIYLGQQLQRYGLVSGNQWSGAIDFQGLGYGSTSMCKNNIIRYNLIYNIYGEGILSPNGTIIYNLLGDTASVAIDLTTQDFDALTSVTAYNLIVMSDWKSSIYSKLAGIGPHGIRVYDELAGGDNSAADMSIYGNVIINRARGIQVTCYDGGDTSCGQGPYASVKIYNNLMIDNRIANISINQPDEVDYLYFYNNVSVLYDRTGSSHTVSVTPGPHWTISNNAFWTAGGSPKYDSDYGAGVVTTDPRFPGEPALDWDGLTGTNYFHMIDFAKHLYISPDSSLANAGKILGSGYNNMFLTADTDFNNFSFKRIPQPGSTKWCIGPIIPEAISGKPGAGDPKRPTGFRLGKK